MINVILPIIDKIDEYQKMLEYLSKRQDITVFIGVDEKFKDKIVAGKNFLIKVFKTKSAKEEIINSLHSINKESGGIIVIRRPLDEVEFINLLHSDDDIAYLSKKRNKFSQFFADLWVKIIRRLFAFFFFEDISAVYFKEEMFDLVTALNNLSYITRINRFVGFSIGSVETTHKRTKRDFDRFSISVNFLISILFFVICILCSIILCTSFGVNVLNVVFAFAIVFVGFTLFLISLLNLARTVSVGRLRYGRAEEII